jgi:hypothetical protein
MLHRFTIFFWAQVDRGNDILITKLLCLRKQHSQYILFLKKCNIILCFIIFVNYMDSPLTDQKCSLYSLKLQLQHSSFCCLEVKVGSSVSDQLRLALNAPSSCHIPVTQIYIPLSHCSLIGPVTSPFSQSLVILSLYIHTSTCLLHPSWAFQHFKMRPQQCVEISGTDYPVT